MIFSGTGFTISPIPLTGVGQPYLAKDLVSDEPQAIIHPTLSHLKVGLFILNLPNTHK